MWLSKVLKSGGLSIDSPAAEVGNPASLDKVFFFTDYFSLGYMQ